MIPELGERALSIGQTGSGKTVFNLWLLKQHEQTPFIIYDTKHEPKFDQLPASKRVHSQKAVDEAIDDETIDYIIYEPPLDIVASSSMLDHLLWEHYISYHNVGAYIDEVTNFNSSPLKVEKGLLSLLSRGRSKGITTLMSTQRPKGLATQCLTEAQRFYVFALTWTGDRKRIEEYVPGYEGLPALTVGEHKFWYKEIGKPGIPRLFNPVPVDEVAQSGYIDAVIAPTALDGATDASPETPTVQANKSLIWI